MALIDLYLGGDLGLWTLGQVEASSVGQVFTFDEDSARCAQSLNIRTGLGDANTAASTTCSVGLSVHYPRILKPRLLGKYRRIYNLHPGYLPWGRGYYPVFWALWEETPAGATLHEMVDGVDEGPIVAQARVEYFSWDTGGSLHQRVREAEKELFLEYWPKIVGDEYIQAFPQSREVGSHHTKKEFFEVKNNTHWETLTGTELIKLVRCLTFPGYSGFEIVLGDRKFQILFEAAVADIQMEKQEATYENKH